MREDGKPVIVIKERYLTDEEILKYIIKCFPRNFMKPTRFGKDEIGFYAQWEEELT